LKRTMLFGAVAILAVALAAIAWAQPQRAGAGPHHPPPIQPDWWNNPDVQDELDLTDEQIDALEEAHASFEKAARSLRFDIQQAKLDIERAFSEKSVDSKKVSELAKRLGSLHGELTESRIKHRLKLVQILTYEQRQKIEKFLERAHRHRRGGGGFGPGAGPKPSK